MDAIKTPEVFNWRRVRVCSIPREFRMNDGNNFGIRNDCDVSFSIPSLPGTRNRRQLRHRRKPHSMGSADAIKFPTSPTLIRRPSQNRHWRRPYFAETMTSFYQLFWFPACYLCVYRIWRWWWNVFETFLSTGLLPFKGLGQFDAVILEGGLSCHWFKRHSCRVSRRLRNWRHRLPSFFLSTSILLFNFSLLFYFVHHHLISRSVLAQPPNQLHIAGNPSAFKAQSFGRFRTGLIVQCRFRWTWLPQVVVFVFFPHPARCAATKSINGRLPNWNGRYYLLLSNRNNNSALALWCSVFPGSFPSSWPEFTSWPCVSKIEKVPLLGRGRIVLERKIVVFCACDL